MKKRTVQQVLATLGGVALGGLLVFIILARLGSSRTDVSPSPTETVPSTTVTPSPELVTPSPDASPTTSPTQGTTTQIENLGAQITLPEGYHVATALNLYEASLTADKRFTITRAPEALEQEYIALVKSLRESGAATEAPTFAPGSTITLQEALNSNAEQSDAALARSKDSMTTSARLSGTRYRRVEGLQTYDITYLAFPAGRRVAVHMTYSSEEPQFDENAYTVVIESLRPQ